MTPPASRSRRKRTQPPAVRQRRTSRKQAELPKAARKTAEPAADLFPRASGILLHPTSLPGRFGIGELGAEAREFVDWLQSAGQSLWQVLPLHPTGYGDSPYQCFSAFAGNPLLISLEQLVKVGLLERNDLAGGPDFPAERVDYGAVIAWKMPLLRKAAQRFGASASPRIRHDFDSFCRANAAWLDDFALFMALKDAHGGIAWTRWEPSLAQRDRAVLAAVAKRLATHIAAHRFWQFEFERQWQELKAYALKCGIRIVGDVPIYVAHDSADVWANSRFFQLAFDGSPLKVAGVPPDYFSATGQLWGNPLYRWDVLKRDGFKWWVARMRRALDFYDIIRLDHFRGFEAYWEVPASDKTAMHGRWVKGPGAELFRVLQRALGKLPIIAENLGVITPEVEAIRHRFGYPGMAILQFAFGNDPQGPSFRPHNYVRNLVAYTGTHDNDTAVGWWRSGAGAGSTRTRQDVEKEHAFARAYLGLHPGDEAEINWVLIRALLRSVANTALIPLQDVLGVGGEGRMNLPGRPGGNWRWRFRREMLSGEMAARLRELVEVYGRLREAPPKGHNIPD